MPKYIVECEVIIKRKFTEEVSALNKDMAIKSVSRKLSKAGSITIHPQSDEVVIVENLSAKRNRKKKDKRGFSYWFYQQCIRFELGKRNNYE